VLFSGGRGSGVLSRQLVTDPRVRLTIAINGYDDGASTGEVRRFLGDSLGPSDFRKNASRLASELRTCPTALVAALDSRLPRDVDREQAVSALHAVAASTPRLATRLNAFLSELSVSTRPFAFGDCSVGNLVFAGAFILAGRHFNAAIDDYCQLLGLPPGVIDNVTDGTNAFLVALTANGSVLGSEEEIVDARRHNRVAEIFLIDRPLGPADRDLLRTVSAAQAAAFFAERRAAVRLNPRLADALADANVIVYAPGTQHSSLFPSYLTTGLRDAISSNLRAIKLLITNIQADAEIEGSSAVDIIERALFYLKERGTVAIPTPCLITHYIVNDPGHAEASTPYVPLGQIDTLEDPRLVRIANYEDGISGRHDAARILGPFIRSFLDRRPVQRVAVLLHDEESVNKIAQTLIEMVRGGIGDLPVAVTVFYEGCALEPTFVRSLPLEVVSLGADADTEFRQRVQDGGFDYVVLFESSGMYRGEDVAGLASHLGFGRLDAVWGSRRLSVRDIEESLRLRYRQQPWFRAASYAGSHVLSLVCLLLYGRYISDTLSAVRAVRADEALAIDVPLTHKHANHHLLAHLLRRKAEILEVPVHFLPISPERVKRTSIVEGLQAVGALLRGRLRRTRTTAAAAAPGDRRPADERSTHPVASR